MKNGLETSTKNIGIHLKKMEYRTKKLWENS